MTEISKIGNPGLIRLAEAIDWISDNPDLIGGLRLKKPDFMSVQHLWVDGLVNMNFFRNIYGQEYVRLEYEIGQRAANYLMIESQGVFWRQHEAAT